MFTTKRYRGRAGHGGNTWVDAHVITDDDTAEGPLTVDAVGGFQPVSVGSVLIATERPERFTVYPADLFDEEYHEFVPSADDGDDDESSETANV